MRLDLPMKRAMGAARMARVEASGLGYLPNIIAHEDRLEEVIHFLIRALEDKPKRGKKPVAMHSLRVGFSLLSLGFEIDVVIGGLLHDILEKTSLSGNHIARRFGPAVGKMVVAATNNDRIDEPMARYLDSVRRCAAVGEGALLIRAADLIDNCDRLMALGSAARLERTAAKMRLLLNVCREELVDPRMVEELARRHRRISRRVGGLALVSKKSSPGPKASRIASRNR